MPGLVPTVLLTGGLIAAAAVTTIATIRDQRDVTGPANSAGTLFGATWATGFTALALLIAALGQTLDNQLVHTCCGPPGPPSSSDCSTSWAEPCSATRCSTPWAPTSPSSAPARCSSTSPGHYWMLAIAGAPAYLRIGRRRTTAIRRGIAGQHT